MIPAFAIGAYGVGFVLATVLALRGAWKALAIALVITAGIFVFCWYVPKNFQGFDSIGYAIAGYLICLPAGGGLLSGGIMGGLIYRARRSKAK